MIDMEMGADHGVDRFAWAADRRKLDQEARLKIDDADFRSRLCGDKLSALVDRRTKA
jgi:hypothetical protein